LLVQAMLGVVQKSTSRLFSCPKTKQNEVLLMAMFRIEKSKGYTVMTNHHLRNKSLSLKAKGL